MLETRRPALFAIALSVGIIFAIAERFVFASALGRPVDLTELDVLVMNAALVSIPFLVLATRRSGRLLPWLMTLVVTAALHWWWLAKGIAYQQAPDGSGVDMFGALIMLVSPLPITALAIALDLQFKRLR